MKCPFCKIKLSYKMNYTSENYQVQRYECFNGKCGANVGVAICEDGIKSFIIDYDFLNKTKCFDIYGSGEGAGYVRMNEDIADAQVISHHKYIELIIAFNIEDIENIMIKIKKYNSFK